jgi:hypothetical protein
MTVENSSVIDGMGSDPATGRVTLMISDHLDWEDEKAHLYVLQQKLNSYLDFVQSGQVYETHPEGRQAGVRIQVFAKYLAPPSAGWFFQRATEVAQVNGVEFEYGELPEQFRSEDSRARRGANFDNFGHLNTRRRGTA